MKRLLGFLFACAVIGAGVLAALIFVFSPDPLSATDLPSHQADLENGKKIYSIGGCRSCHVPHGSGSDALPTGGLVVTPAGKFVAPNLTPDEATGIGGWSDVDFVNAVTRGITPGGSHYFPVFPYASYQIAKLADVLDLKAYLDSLPPTKTERADHQIPFFVAWARPLIGTWKALAGLEFKPFEQEPSKSAAWNTGHYLVRGFGHCGECHTPRTAFMALDTSRWLEGAPHPDPTCKGQVPAIDQLAALTKDTGEMKYPKLNTLALALQHGEEWGFEGLADCEMGQVQTNISKLPETDIKAIAEYLMSPKL